MDETKLGWRRIGTLAACGRAVASMQAACINAAAAAILASMCFTARVQQHGAGASSLHRPKGEQGLNCAATLPHVAFN